MTDDDGMSLERFAQLTATYGADFDRWPEQHRARGRHLVLQSPTAQELRARAAELDAWLARAPELEPSAELLARVEAIPRQHPRADWWPFRTRIVPALALAAAAVLGVAAGSVVFSTAPARSGSESSLAAEEQEWEELSELAFSAGLYDEDVP